MSLFPTRRPKEAVDPPPHPNTGETWFQSLPPQRRVAMQRERDADLLHTQTLIAREKQRMLVESLRMGAAFAIGDFLSPHASFPSVGLALLAGLVIGLLCTRIDAHRMLSALLGGGGFFALEWMQRGGLAPLHLFVFYPMISVCALIGYVREDRGSL